MNVSPFPDDHDFKRVGDGQYQFTVTDLNTEFHVQHVRRERYQLYGEVSVYCGLKGVQTYNGLLFTADVNLSRLSDRDQLARSLASRTNSQADANRWASIVSELSARVKQAEDVGVGIVTFTRAFRIGAGYSAGTSPRRGKSSGSC